MLKSFGCWLKAPSGFVREDNSEKPSYHALQKLIHQDWKTHETLITDSEGRISCTGFKGDYILTVEGQSLTLNLDQDRAETLTIL